MSTLGIAAGIARRPFVKRRPYQPKPKPGEAKRPDQPFVPRDSSTPRPHQNFQERAARSSSTSPARRQLRSRARHKTASKILARTIPRVPISNRAHQPQAVARRNRHSQNHSAQNHTAKNPVAPGNPAHLSGGKAPEARNHTAAESHSENSARTPLVAPIKIPTTIAPSNQNPKPPGAAPNRRNPAAAPSASGGPGSKFRKFPPTGGSRKPGAPWKSRKPSEPGAFGRAKSKFTKPGGRPTGMKPRPGAGGPKRSGHRPGQHKPKPGNFTGPKGRR